MEVENARNCITTIAGSKEIEFGAYDQYEDNIKQEVTESVLVSSTTSADGPRISPQIPQVIFRGDKPQDGNKYLLLQFENVKYEIDQQCPFCYRYISSSYKEHILSHIDIGFQHFPTTIVSTTASHIKAEPPDLVPIDNGLSTPTTFFETLTLPSSYNVATSLDISSINEEQEFCRSYDSNINSCGSFEQRTSDKDECEFTVISKIQRHNVGIHITRKCHEEYRLRPNIIDAKTSDHLCNRRMQVASLFRCDDRSNLSRCTKCQAKVPNSLADQMKHLKDLHSRTRNLQCEQCDSAKCSLCNEIFRDVRFLSKHLKHSHAIPEPYQCSMCKKSFFRLRQLKAHQRNTHIMRRKRRTQKSVAALKCIKCNKQFKTKKQLFVHNESHSTTVIAHGYRKMSDHLIKEKSAHKQNLKNKCTIVKAKIMN